MLSSRNLPLNVFSSMKSLPKEITTSFTWIMKEEKNLAGKWKYIWINNGRFHLRQCSDHKSVTIKC